MQSISFVAVIWAIRISRHEKDSIVLVVNSSIGLAEGKDAPQHCSSFPFHHLVKHVTL